MKHILNETHLQIITKGNRSGGIFLRPTILADYIVSMHHSYARKELVLIQRYLKQIMYTDLERYTEIEGMLLLFGQLKSRVQTYMDNQEILFFPRITQAEKISSSQASKLNACYLLKSLSYMEKDLDEILHIIRKIRSLLNNYITTQEDSKKYCQLVFAFEMFEADLYLCMHLENNILFPKVKDMLAA